MADICGNCRRAAVISQTKLPDALLRFCYGTWIFVHAAVRLAADGLDLLDGPNYSFLNLPSWVRIYHRAAFGKGTFALRKKARATGFFNYENCQSMLNRSIFFKIRP